MIAGSPNEGMGPNVDRIDNGEGEGQAFSVPPRAGEKRPWDEAGGMDHVLEATVLRLMMRHGFQASSSSSSQRMVSQEIQTELSGEVVLLEKSKSKITDEPSGGGGVDLISAMGSEDKASKGLSEVAEMHPEEILELEAVIQEEHEEEQAQLEQLQLASDTFLKGSEAPKIDAVWEMHFSMGRPYYYDIVTGRTQWECPEGFENTAEKVTADEKDTVSAKEKGNTRFLSQCLNWVL